MLSVYQFILDLHTTQSQVSLPVTAGDTGRTLLISFSDGGRLYPLGDVDFTVYIKNTDTQETVEGEISKVRDDGLTIEYEFDRDTCPTEGVYIVEILLHRGERRIATPKFTLEAAAKITPNEPQ
jgi:hypothetical protein